jgi:hypothetical protein
MIKRRRTLLDGICPEVIELLKDMSVNPVTFDVLRQMRPMRQIESAELMLTVHNWTSSYAKALLAATKQEDRAKPDRPKKIGGLTRQQMARMEREMASLHQDFKQIGESYGDDILHLVVASGYLNKLVGNSEIERFSRAALPGVSGRIPRHDCRLNRTLPRQVVGALISLALICRPLLFPTATPPRRCADMSPECFRKRPDLGGRHLEGTQEIDA